MKLTRLQQLEAEASYRRQEYLAWTHTEGRLSEAERCDKERAYRAMLAARHAVDREKQSLRLGTTAAVGRRAQNPKKGSGAWHLARMRAEQKRSPPEPRNLSNARYLGVRHGNERNDLTADAWDPSRRGFTVSYDMPTARMGREFEVEFPRWTDEEHSAYIRAYRKVIADRLRPLMNERWGVDWFDRAHRANPKTESRLSARRSRNPVDPKAIVRIIKVRDTRQYEEGPDEKWSPIPGSGVPHECARCGRIHEVHAHVELADGSQAIVGTGCMGAAALNVEARKMASKAATTARAEGRLLRARQVLADFDTAVREIERMGVPEVQFTLEQSARRVGRDKGVEVPTLKATAEDGYTWRMLQLGNVDTPQLRRQMAQEAVQDWMERRLKERGFKHPRFAYENVVEEAERLARRAGVQFESTSARRTSR